MLPVALLFSGSAGVAPLRPDSSSDCWPFSMRRCVSCSIFSASAMSATFSSRLDSMVPLFSLYWVD